MRKTITFLCIFALFSAVLAAQSNKWSSSRLHHEIQKLNFLGTALYVAAHPDDENQRIISYLSNKLKARTAYLSLTRGDGGQNLIGPELREQLGVLRTQELLAARSIDGGEQFFSRAVDFGYSKNPDETHTIWNKDVVLGDVVWTLRSFRPDIIINRFDHRTPGTTHGHHTSSAMLSVEAFDLAYNKNVYPEQLKHTKIWQPKRIFFNTSWWFYGSRENFKKADKSNLSVVDIGVYYPQFGLSNNEIAAMARSQHKCQGFGQLTSRGSTEEYLELLKGQPLSDNANIFEGINTSWSRIKEGKAIGEILEKVETAFDFANPAKHVPDLVKAYKLVSRIEDDYWRTSKSEHLKEIILAAAGIYLEANATTDSATRGEELSVGIEAVNRSTVPVLLKEVKINDGLKSIQSNTSLENNKKETFELTFTVPQETAFTSPYWLTNEASLGLFDVADQKLIGKPENENPFYANFHLAILNEDLVFRIPVLRRFSKPEKGELFRPLSILPEVTTGFNDNVFIFSSESPKKVAVNVRAGKANISGKVELRTENGWIVAPKQIDFNIKEKNAFETFYFSVTPPNSESQTTFSSVASINGKSFTDELIEIDYDHIYKQNILLPAKAKAVRMNIKKNGHLIGYIEGAGDKVPESLKQIGYSVEQIDVASMTPDGLRKYDGIVTGIRAYNVNDALKLKQDILFDYVKNGGNLVVQYNTAGRWAAQFENIAPYPITISRDRVTDENAKVTLLAPEHELLNTPNKIGSADFNGWVQERGLYFPNKWSTEFTPLLAMKDVGESPKKGSLLVAPYGRGNYIYTGLSFFRELPAGVPGAFKLFANMLSLKNEKIKNMEHVRGK